jgi:hypothetical protein
MLATLAFLWRQSILSILQIRFSTDLRNSAIEIEDQLEALAAPRYNAKGDCNRAAVPDQQSVSVACRMSKGQDGFSLFRAPCCAASGVARPSSEGSSAFDDPLVEVAGGKTSDGRGGLPLYVGIRVLSRLCLSSR